MINNLLSKTGIVIDFIKKEYFLLILLLLIFFSFGQPIKKAYYEKFEIVNYTNQFENSQYMNITVSYEQVLVKSVYKIKSENLTEKERRLLEIERLFDYMPGLYTSNSTAIMSDADIYAYRSYLYIHGIIHPLTSLPIIVHGNTPSIFMGLSILFLKTQYIASIIVGLICLFLLFLLVQLLFRNKKLSFAIVGLFCLDSIFRLQLFSTLLDLYQCLFILLSFYLLFKIMDDGKKNRKNYVLLILSLGGAISVKPMMGVILIFVIFVYFLCINSIQNFKIMLKYILFSFFIYLIIEWPKLVFLKRLLSFYGHLSFGTLIEVVKTLFFAPFNSQIIYNTSRYGYSFEIFKMLFSGKWKSIFTGNLEKLYPFSILIILFSSASFFSIYYILKRRKGRKEIKLLLFYLWLVIYCIAVSFKNNIFPWYLTEILPSIYILGGYVYYCIASQLFKSKIKN